jgi:hypothetical protein
MNRSGMSLVEVLISAAIVVVIAAGIFQAMAYITKIEARDRALQLRHQNLDQVSVTLSRKDLSSDSLRNEAQDGTLSSIQYNFSQSQPAIKPLNQLIVLGQKWVGPGRPIESIELAISSATPATTMGGKELRLARVIYKMSAQPSIESFVGIAEFSPMVDGVRDLLSISIPETRFRLETRTFKSGTSSVYDQRIFTDEPNNSDFIWGCREDLGWIISRCDSIPKPKLNPEVRIYKGTWTGTIDAPLPLDQSIPTRCRASKSKTAELKMICSKRAY